MLRAANDLTRSLQGLGEHLAAAADEGQVFQAGCEALAAALGCQAVALAADGDAAGRVTLRRAAAQPPSAELSPNDLAAADWVLEHSQNAGRFTRTLAGSPWWFVPMIADRRCLGVVGARFPEGQEILASEQRQLAQAIVQQTAQAAERTRLVASLEASRLEGEAERLRTALLSSISHDLRSPLAAIIGGATSLSAYGATMSETDRGELLDSIRREGERLDRYIQNLLDMTRLGSGPIKLHRDWVGLDEILRSATDRLARLSPGSRVETELAADLPPLYVHGALVEQALFNVLENAAKFSPHGAPVTVRARRAGDTILVDVVDRGPGIPEEERRRIFDMFYSVERGDRGSRGTGLGLTIVRGMIGAHGGLVEALPGDGGAGTTIRIRLPLVEPPHAAAEESA